MRAGGRVEAAEEGEEALRQALTRRLAANLLDTLLPKPDGWEVLRALKPDRDHGAIPVLVLSVIDRRKLGKELGAAAVLVKPARRDAALEQLAALGVPAPGLRQTGRGPRGCVPVSGRPSGAAPPS